MRRAAHLGVGSLVLPIRYIDIPAPGDLVEDSAVSLLNTFQFVDWREIRHKRRRSASYRRAVADIVDRLAEASASLERDPPSPLRDLTVPGVVEDRLDGLMSTVGSVIAIMSEVTVAVLEGTLTSKRSGRPAGLRHMANALRDPVRRLGALADELVGSLYDADPLILDSLSRADGVEPLVERLQRIATSLPEATAAAEDLCRFVEPFDTADRDFRLLARRLRTTLLQLAEGFEITARWATVADRRSESARA